MTYLIYLVASDESATILNTPVCVTEALPTEMSDDVILDVVKTLLRENDVTLPDDITTGVDALHWMREEECVYYSEDTFVVVEDKNNIKDKLEVIGDALLGTMGDDSSCYRAAASWRMVVQSHGIVSYVV